MSFRNIDTKALARFNSSTSAALLDMIHDQQMKDNLDSADQIKSKTFAPSSLRCHRLQWFRLRGTKPDTSPKLDTALDFTAMIGTACHEYIQSIISRIPGIKWVDVEDRLSNIYDKSYYSCVRSGYETRVSLCSPPVNFACDGLIEFQGKLYLVEIKTCEFRSFEGLHGPKPQHVSQIQCYSTLLCVSNVLVIYVDRQYGNMKCYELHISEKDQQAMNSTFTTILDCVNTNLAPDPLPKGDTWCTSSMCPYYFTCKEYGKL